MTTFRTIFVRRFALTPLLLVAIFATFFATLAAPRSTSGADALAPIAPFVDSKTLCVVRVDLSQIDFDKLAETLDAIFAQTLTSANAPADAIADARQELAKTLDAAKKTGRGALDAFRESSGLTQAFLLVQNAKGAGFAVVVPASNLTEDQRDAFQAFAENADWNCALYKKAFLVASPQPLKEFGKFYRDFQPGVNADMSKFFDANADKAAAFYCGRFRIRAVLDELTDGMAKMLIAAQPKSVRSALETFDASLGDVRGYFDAGTVSARLEIRFRSATEAGQMRAQLEKIVDDRADETYKQMSESGVFDIALPAAFSPDGEVAKESDVFNLGPLTRELVRGSSKSNLPKQNGDRLVSEFSLVDATKKGDAALIVAVCAVGVMSPAIRAARALNEIDFEAEEIDFDDASVEPELETPDVAPELDGSNPNGDFNKELRALLNAPELPAPNLD